MKNPMTRNPQEWEMWCAKVGAVFACAVGSKVIQHTLSAVAYCHSKGCLGPVCAV